MVPNPTLKDNHQAELAEEVQTQGYAIWGRLGQIDYAVEQSELLSDKNAIQFKPHPIAGAGAASPGVDVWSVSAAMMDSTAQGRGRPAASLGPSGELRREETAQMSMD